MEAFLSNGTHVVASSSVVFVRALSDSCRISVGLVSFSVGLVSDQCRKIRPRLRLVSDQCRKIRPRVGLVSD